MIVLAWEDGGGRPGGLGVAWQGEFFAQLAGFVAVLLPLGCWLVGGGDRCVFERVACCEEGGAAQRLAGGESVRDEVEAEAVDSQPAVIADVQLDARDLLLLCDQQQ